MFSDLLSCAKTLGINGGNNHPGVAIEEIKGLCIRAFIDMSGKLLDVEVKPDKAVWTSINIRSAAKMFPKISVNISGVTALGVNGPKPSMQSPGQVLTALQGVTLDWNSDAIKSINGKSKFADELRLSFVTAGVPHTLLGDAVIAFTNISDKASFIQDVFKLVLSRIQSDTGCMMVATDLAWKKTNPMPIPVFVCVKDSNGIVSGDKIEFDLIKKIVPLPDTVQVVGLDGKTFLSFDPMPKINLKGIGMKSIYSRNKECPSVYFYGDCGAKTFPVPATDFNRVQAVIEHLCRDNKTHSVVTSDGTKQLVMVIFDEKNPLPILDGITSTPENRQVLLDNWSKDMLDALMLANDAGVSDYVEFLVIEEIDKSNAALSKKLVITRQKIKDSLELWNNTCQTFNCNKVLPRDLLFALGDRLITSQGKIKSRKSEKKLAKIGDVIDFFVGDDPTIADKVLRITLDNIKPAIRFGDLKTIGKAERYIFNRLMAFIMLAVSKKGMDDMSDMYGKFGRMCAAWNNLQQMYWEEHRIAGKYNRGIGTEALDKALSGSSAIAYAMLKKGTKYLAWADRESKIGNNKGLMSNAILQISAEAFTDEEAVKFLNSRPRNIDIGMMLNAFVSWRRKKTSELNGTVAITREESGNNGEGNVETISP